MHHRRVLPVRRRRGTPRAPPAAHVRRPRVDYESHAVALDRNELGALLIAVGLGPPAEHALISLLALNGLRVSEATGADIEQLGLEPGHRTLTITRKGGKVITIPLAPRTARAIDLAKLALDGAAARTAWRYASARTAGGERVQDVRRLRSQGCRVRARCLRETAIPGAVSRWLPGTLNAGRGSYVIAR
jgi:integrase